MLYFRRICLLVALALTFGASDVFAQGAPPGISVRIVSPADSAWVGIGGKIVVEVSSRPLLSQIRATGNTDTTFLGYASSELAAGVGIDEVLLYVDGTPNDKSVAGGATRTLTGYPGNVSPGDSLVCRVNFLHNSPTVSGNKRRVTWDINTPYGSGHTPGCKVTGEVRSFSGSVHVARYTFEIKPELATIGTWDFRAGVSGIYAVAAARAGGGSFQAVANVEAGGDGKFVQIDTGRPIHMASHFDTIGVVGKANNATFKIGSKIELMAQVLGLASDATAIELGLFGHDGDYAPGYNSLRDSALVKSLTRFEIDRDRGTIAGADANNVLRKTITVEENAFKIVGDATDNDTYDATNKTTLMDNLRFKVAVFFVDRANNIGGTAADGDPQPFSSADLTYTVDSKKPKITLKRPVDHPDSNRFTGLVFKTFNNYYEDDGNPEQGFRVDFKPLNLKVDEDLRSLVAVAKAGNKTDRPNITSDYTTVGAFQDIQTTGKFAPNVKSNNSAKGGKKFNLTIEATDQVGNKATKTVNNVWHDQDVPAPIRRFPSEAALGDDNPTINNETRHPVLRFNESLDSLSVRFIEATTTNPRNAIQKAGNNLLTMVNKDITINVDSSLVNSRRYWFQVYARDLAGNVDITPAERFTFSTSFVNPQADSFKVVATSGDTAIAGYLLPIEITALNAALTRSAKADRVAVTYRSGDVRVKAMMADGSDASDVVISGGGVVKDEGGYFALNSANWNVGVYKINIKSNKVLNGLKVVVEETDTTPVDGEPKTTVEFSNTLGDITIDEGDMRRFVVTAWEGDGEADTVSGEFKVRVVPADSLGNPSVKYGEELTGGNIGTPGLFDKAKPSKLVSIDVEFSASHPNAAVPQGSQTVKPEGTSFSVIAPNSNGEDLTITARVANLQPGTSLTDVNKYLGATGSVTVDYTVAEPTSADSLAAPAYLEVIDVPEDQGHYVTVTFPLSTDHDVVDSYRLYREFDIGDGRGSRFIPWGDDFEPSGNDSLVTRNIGVPDALATHWAIEAIGAKPSSQTVSGKLSAAVIVSDRTQTAEKVRALDNKPPEAATDVMLENLTVSWTLSPSEGPTDATYTDPRFAGSQARAIPGVTGYEIMVGLSADALYSVGKVDAGESSFELTSQAIASLLTSGVISPEQIQQLLATDLLGVTIRVDALDLSNSVPSEIFVVEKLTRREFTSADNEPVYIVNLDGDMTVGFDDFVAFAAAFDTRDGDEAWNIQADLNDDGTVDFADFILFVGSYGKTAQGPSTKPVILPPGVNENAEFSLRLGSERVVVGQNVFVDVSLANVQDLMGYGFVLNYDADKFEFVEAAPADQDLLKSTGGETPLFSSLANEAGQVSIANAVVNASEVSGGGDIVRLTFRVLQEFAENARFEIAEGLVFDPQQLSNPAVVAGVLNVQTTPTEFALLQNFPNPFNPETTIGYELAESADVTLQIYNVVGQVVRTLIAAEPQAAGRYQMRWDGMDDRGVSVSSGVYFYRISAGEFQTVRKLMLLK